MPFARKGQAIIRKNRKESSQAKERICTTRKTKDVETESCLLSSFFCLWINFITTQIWRWSAYPWLRPVLHISERYSIGGLCSLPFLMPPFCPHKKREECIYCLGKNWLCVTCGVFWVTRYRLSDSELDQLQSTRCCYNNDRLDVDAASCHHDDLSST